MKTIPNIKLTEEELHRILKRALVSGGEGIICVSDIGTLYKIFINPETKEIIPMPENKHRKIIRQWKIP